MRRLVAASIAVLSLGTFAPGSAGATLTSDEQRWMKQAETYERAGNTTAAIEVWTRLVASLKSHDFWECGQYAQKLGRALDGQKRFGEAVTAFDAEVECWGNFRQGASWSLWDARRAEQLRPEIRTFTARPAESERPGPLGKHEPRFGTMIGGTIDLDPEVMRTWHERANINERAKSAYGKPHKIVLVYARWNQPIPTVATANASDAGAWLQVGWEPSEGLDAVVDDQYVRGFLRRLKEYGQPIFLRYASEFNDGTYAWYGDPAKYREKFALITRIAREEAPNVAMVWAPSFAEDPDAPIDDYYPGDEWVDWVGVDVYHDPYFASAKDNQMLGDIYYQTKRSNPLHKVKAIYERYADRKPMMIAETGFAWGMRKPSEVEEVEWAAETMRKFYTYLPMLYPRIKAICYFNVDFVKNPQVPSLGHYILSSKPLMAETLRSVTSNDWYMGGGSSEPGTFWRPLERATLLGPTRLATYAHLGDPGVSRVAYLLDGRVIASSTVMPYEATVDFSGLTGKHILTVRAYDREGRPGFDRLYPFDASSAHVRYNGRLLDFDQPPVIANDRVLVPARFIMEAMGIDVAWEQSTWTVVAVRDGHTLRLPIGKSIATLDGEPLPPMDSPPQLHSGRTLIPLRFVSETFQVDVRWDAATQTVSITDGR